MKAWTAIRKRYGSRIHHRTSQLDPVIRSTLRDEVAASLGDVILVPEQQLQVRQELDEINQELEQAKGQLEKFISDEQFLGLRIYKYRKALDHQAQELLDQAKTATQAKKNPTTGSTTTDMTEPLVVVVDAVSPMDDEHAATIASLIFPNPTNNDKKDHPDDHDDEDDSVVKISEEMEELELQRKMDKWEEEDKALTDVVDHHKDLLAKIETMRRKIDDLERKRMDTIHMTEECRDVLVASSPSEEDHSGELPPHATTITAVPNTATAEYGLIQGKHSV